jgi:hypothetical protein
MPYTGSKYVEDDFLNIARGIVKGASSNHKFGAVPSMSNNNSGTVWDINDTLYPWTALDTPAVVNVERNDVADEGFVVTVQGLDSNYNFQSENITISGTDTLGTKLFRRVNRVFCTHNGDTNTGNINIEAGAAGGTTVARINAGKGQTLMAVYTVPAGYNAYLLQGTATCQIGADATGDMFVRYFGQDTFRVGHSFEVSGAGGQYFYKFGVPIRISEKSDIDVRAAVRSNNARITASFDVILIERNQDRAAR